MLKKRLLMTAIVSLFITAAGFAAVQEELRDDVMLADATRVVGGNTFYTIFDIVNVKVNHGVVTLDGLVTEPYKKNAFAQDILKEVAGVREVKNNIEILPPSSTDDILRLTIARKIYNNNSLLRYGLAKWPYPIHVIVRNGHVDLYGQVENEMDKALVNNEVRSVPGIISVTDELTTDHTHKKTD